MREANAIFLFINVNDNSKHSRNSSASLSPQSHPISLSLSFLLLYLKIPSNLVIKISLVTTHVYIINGYLSSDLPSSVIFILNTIHVKRKLRPSPPSTHIRFEEI